MHTHGELIKWELVHVQVNIIGMTSTEIPYYRL